MTPADENPLTNQNLTFEVETAIEINKDSTYSGFTNTVVHHEFLITKTSASYTTMDGWVFDCAYNVDGYQSWLLNTKIKTVVIDEIPYVTLRRRLQPGCLHKHSCDHPGKDGQQR